jgi:hypothetical protein
MREFVLTRFAELSIPSDETYDLHLVIPAGQISYGQPVERGGESDRFEC